MPARFSLRSLSWLVLVAATGIALPIAMPCARASDRMPASAPGGTWPDPLTPMLRRIDRYLQQAQVDGVTMDWRYSVIPSEEIRQTVVCQLLAYVELARLDPRPRLRAEILRHADYLLPRLADVRSYTPFDGMLAYALLGAYEITGEPRYLDAGTEMMNDLLAIPTSQCILNGGLMVAMATAEYWKLTGHAGALQKTHDIVAQLVPYQNADGSFPHWCYGSRDIHYTAWMAMELIHIGRLVPDALIDPFLASMSAFLEARIAPNGRAIYEEPCPDEQGCTLYYYSRATGCSQDLDSRGWTVEPAYCGLLFDREGASEYQPVMSFLDSLEDGGTLPDLYDYWPPPSDPEYPWTIADTSVVNMSIILWVLSTEAADRVGRGVPLDLVLDDLIDLTEVPGPGTLDVARPLAAVPNPAHGACRLRFSLRTGQHVRLEVFDTSGRRIRTIESQWLGAGPHETLWDGRDFAGRSVPEGVYLARLRRERSIETRRIVFLR